MFPHQNEDMRNFLARMLANKNIRLLILVAAGILLIISGCAPETGITVAGSTSVQPFAELLAEEFMRLHPEITINVQGGGSSAGILATTSGTCSIGMSSRELTDKEKTLNRIEIARDGLALIVHPSNPVKNLTISQVGNIYADNIDNWSLVGGPNSKIHIVSREEGSGTRSAFETMLMGEKRITAKAIIQDSNGAVRQVIANDPAAIGFISLGLVNKEVKALDIDGIAATVENVLKGQYTLSRPFLFVTVGEPVGEAKQFIDFVLSDEGQGLLAAEGLVVLQK